MEIQVTSLKRCELVSLSGQIDGASAPEMEQALVHLVEAGKKNLVLSFRGVTFISSAGIKALAAVQIRARRRVPPAEIAIADLQPEVKRTLQLVGLDHLFRFYEQALEVVGSF
jgi:anti-sigma B factor antagonist